MYLSASTTPDDCSEGSGGKISRNIFQDLLPSNTIHRATLHIGDFGLGEFGLQRVRKRGGDLHFDLEIPNSDVGGVNVREGKVLLMVVQDVPFHLSRFVGR